jgi:hypothetical protein
MTWWFLSSVIPKLVRLNQAQHLTAPAVHLFSV